MNLWATNPRIDELERSGSSRKLSSKFYGRVLVHAGFTYARLDDDSRNARTPSS